MTRSFHHFIVATFVLGMAISAKPAFAQSELEGVWEVTYATFESEEATEPGLYIFQGEYYSVLHVWAGEPRPLYGEDEDRDNVDFDRLRSVVLPVEGNSGKFEVDGSTVTMSPVVAISPNFMSGGSNTYTFTISGDELSLKGVDFEAELTLQRLH